MTSDPEPDDFIILAKPHGAIGERDANRIDWFGVVDLLELQTRMGGLLPKQPIGLLRERLNIAR